MLDIQELESKLTDLKYSVKMVRLVVMQRT